MKIESIDIIIITTLVLVVVVTGFLVSKSSGKSSSSFFLGSKKMPWWLLGISMVATTFSTDTPNLVTDIVRNDGVSGNWKWWAFLLTGLLTVFIYAKLWRKSNVNTDMEFYTIRYGGKPAMFLRGFRSIYLGVIFNVFAMAAVTLAAIKIGQIMFGLDSITIIIFCSTITLLFSTLGGFKGVVYTDFILFFVAMVGSIGAAIYLVNIPEVGGIDSMIRNPNIADKISILPRFDDTEQLITIFIIPIAVQWWSAWYPGAEPGGGGYIAQRMLAAKTENHAISSTFFFNIMHYALRPWPWIIVALASIVVYPDLNSLKEAFPNVSEDKLGHDLAYSAMLTKLPSGLLGIVLASLISAYMSTISTHLNWGSSYIVNDFYKKFIHTKASEKELVKIGRLSTILLMVLSSITALLLTNALQLFDIILMFGAGTGLIFILRWFWWRINAWSEISAMVSSGVISIIFNINSINVLLFSDEGLFPSYMKFPLIVIISTLVWLTVTMMTKPENKNILMDFYIRINPGGIGWKKIIKHIDKKDIKNTTWNVPKSIFATLISAIMIYSIMFSTSNFIYGNHLTGIILCIFAIFCLFILKRIWNKIKKSTL